MFGIGLLFTAISLIPNREVSGVAALLMGGGVGLGCHGTHRVVGETSQIAMPECGIGLVPDVGGSFILSRAPGHLGEYLAMTGYRMGPGDAVLAGFGDSQIKSEDRARLIAAIEQNSDLSVLGRFAGPAGRPELAEHLEAINRHFSADTALDVIRSLEADPSDWAQQSAKLIRRSCPLSVACALELIRRVRKVETMEEALALEYRFTARSMSDGEFIEGIRAQIIDKDRNPKWQTGSLEEITDSQVEAMLAPLGDMELKFAPKT